MNTNFHVDGRVPSNNPGISYVPTQTSVKPAEVIYHQEEPKPVVEKTPEPPTKYDYLLKMDGEQFNQLFAKLQTRFEEINLELQNKQDQVASLTQIYMRAKLNIDFQQPTTDEEQSAYLRFPTLQKEMSALRAEKDELAARMDDIHFIRPLLNYKAKKEILGQKVNEFLEFWKTNKSGKKNLPALFGSLQRVSAEGASVVFSRIGVDDLLRNNQKSFNSDTSSIIEDNLSHAAAQLQYTNSKINDHNACIRIRAFEDREYTISDLVNGKILDDLLIDLQGQVDWVTKYLEQNNG